jgi:N-acetylmuramoyl-L-alanine amidase
MFDRPTPGQRSAILRGVYDDNRRLHGAAAPAGARARARVPGGRLAGRVALLMFLAGGPLLYAWAPSGQAVMALFAPAAGPGEVAAASPAGASLKASFAPSGSPERSAPASAPDARPEPLSPVPAAVLPPAPRPARVANANDAAARALNLADVAPLVSGTENVKNLFGLSVRNIVIDAGHGGHDPGAIGKHGMREKDITLDVALRLKKKLEENTAYQIRLVRDDDVFVPLNERAAFANGQDTDLFVSIHVNYLPSTSTNAVETYYFGRHQDTRTRKLAERENEGSEYSLSEFEGVMRNMQDTIKLQESKALAHSIQGSLLKSIRARNQRVLDNGVRTAPFVVLLGVKAPSVLVEIGSLSSPQAEKSLGDERYRDEIATYVVAGINQYLNEQLPEEHRIHDKNQSRLAERQ